MIKDFSTVFWGYLPTTKEPYKAHEKVNAFIGPSGHGKTTIWDGLRLMLGGGHFESKRTFSFYVHKKSNWAVVRVAFYNLPINGIRPFEAARKFNDEVTACCRIYKNDQGSWARDYYLIDGAFYDLKDLQFNTKAYSDAALGVGQYLEVLEKCLGITKEFRNLMAMSPDTVREVVNSSPHKLFNLIFDLKGAKEYKQRYDDSKQRLNEQEVAVERAEKEMEEAQTRFELTRQKAQRFRLYQAKEKEIAEVRLKLKKLEYLEAYKALNLTLAEMEVIEGKGKVETDRVNEYTAQIEEKQKAADCLENKYKILDEAEEQANQAITSYAVDQTLAMQEAKEIDEQIQRLKQISPQSIDELEQLKVLLQEDVEKQNLNYSQAKVECAQLRKKLSDLENNLPPYITEAKIFRGALESAQIPFVMLADAVSVKPDMKQWQEAIEAYLGKNRYRIVVDANDYLDVKKLQQQHKYGARVCLPRCGSRTVSQKTLSYPSIYSALDISNQEKIGGYLERLKHVYLVETVEEGHSLQKQGIDSITLQCLLQDNDGAIHLKYNILCCGKSAIEEEKKRAYILLEKQQIILADFENTLHTGQHELSEIEEALRNQRLLQQLSGLEQTYRLRFNEAQRLSDLIKEKTHEKDTAHKEKESIRTNAFHVREQKTRFSEKMQQALLNATEFSKQYDMLQNKIPSLELSFKHALQEIKALGLTQDDIASIPDIKNQAFQDASGNLLISKDMNNKLNMLLQEKEKLYDSSVNEEIVRLVEAQEGQVDLLIQNLHRLKQDRDELDQTCNDLLYQFRGHIKDIMKDYIAEFESFADLLRASAKGKLVEITPEPETWEIQLSIGYDGKEPVAVDGPHLSSGQKASTSLMILLAALSDNKSGKITPIMFLDEPKARVDDERGNEIGQLLQITDIQYFITHQHGESLKTIDWIDHAFTCSACEPGKEFANPLILKRRSRRAYGN